MTVGNKIRIKRTELGHTQKDLADLLNVSPQAVSRWEKDEVEPDISTLNKLSKLFSISVDELIGKEDFNKEENSSPVEVQQVIVQKEIVTCNDCKKQIDKEEAKLIQGTSSRRVGRHTHHTSYEYYLCKDCEAKRKEEAENRVRLAKIRREKKRKKIIIFSFIFGIAMIGIMLAILISSAGVGIAIPVAIVSGYGVFSAIYCIFTESYIEDVFLEVASKSIRMPGIIFRFDWDGLKFLIIMKILFAFLSFFLAIALIVFAFAIAMFLSIFSFPFIFHKHRVYGY